MRALLLLTLLLLAGCASPAATPDRTVKIVGATTEVSNTGRTPILVAVAWRTPQGETLRAEDINLAPGETATRDFVPPSLSTFKVHIEVHEAEAGALGGPAVTMTWSTDQCARWHAFFVYDDAITPVSWGFHDACPDKAD